MRKVLKFTIAFNYWTGVMVPGDVTQVVLVGTDPATRKPAIWIEVDPDQDSAERSFAVIGTGFPIPEEPEPFPVKHVGSYIDGQMAFHVYERTLFYDEAT